MKQLSGGFHPPHVGLLSRFCIGVSSIYHHEPTRERHSAVERRVKAAGLRGGLGPGPPALRESSSRLQLLLQFIQKPPIRTLRDKFFRVGFNHTNLMQSKREIANRVGRIIFAPAVVAQRFHRFEADV